MQWILDQRGTSLCEYGHDITDAITYKLERYVILGGFAEINESRSEAGLEIDFGDVKMLTLTTGGRVMVTLRSGADQVSFVGAYKEMPPRMGLQSIEASFRGAQKMVNTGPGTFERKSSAPRWSNRVWRLDLGDTIEGFKHYDELMQRLIREMGQELTETQAKLLLENYPLGALVSGVAYINAEFVAEGKMTPGTPDWAARLRCLRLLCDELDRRGPNGL